MRVRNIKPNALCFLPLKGNGDAAQNGAATKGNGRKRLNKIHCIVRILVDFLFFNNVGVFKMKTEYLFFFLSQVMVLGVMVDK